MPFSPLQQAFFNIAYNNKTKDFFNVGKLNTELTNSGWTVKGTSYDLIYFDDCQRKSQDYDGVSLMIFIERGGRKYNFYFRHLNLTTHTERQIFDEKGNEVGIELLA